MNGITYYRLKSDYSGDYTKNCALNGTEVDNNFYVLEGRDIKSIAVDDKDIVVTLMNGETTKAEGVLDFVKADEIVTSLVSAEFDKLTGTLKLTDSEGNVQELEGFPTNEGTDLSVAKDNTLIGDGLKTSPLGLASSAKTGQYKPVEAIIDITNGGTLPPCGNVLGDRYVTCEDISDLGYLYDYRAVKDIACELKDSGWRIPTKADWDDLLNAVEPSESAKEHDKADRNRVLGRWAGRLLKSKTLWKPFDNAECDCQDNTCGCNDCRCDGCECGGNKTHSCNCGNDMCFDYTNDQCVGTHECGSSCKCTMDDNHEGLDAYGFRVMPAGYADDGGNYAYYKERSAFWTATTNPNNTKAYIKRFQYNKDGVYQDVIPSNYHLSLRLVKDYDGTNYHDVEEIMDLEYPTLLLPSIANGKSIWTACNVASANASFCPMLPNDGQGLSYVRHFFINEWNGFKWVRNELKEGESIVVKKAPKGKKMIEYRVIENDLVSVNEVLFQDVESDIRPLVEDLDEKLSARLDVVEKAIEAEADRAQDVEKQIWDAINKEAIAREDVDNQQWEAIAREGAAREEVDNQQWEAIGKEAAAREDVDNQQWEAIGKEAAAREEVDNQQWEAINQEIEDRKALQGSLLTQEGSEFNPESGELTLKSIDGINDVKIQFTFNFGEF